MRDNIKVRLIASAIVLTGLYNYLGPNITRRLLKA